jgi:hypothetical protein
MQMLSETTFASISCSVIAGSSNSSNRKSFFPYNLTAFVRIVPYFLLTKTASRTYGETTTDIIGVLHVFDKGNTAASQYQQRQR